MSLAQLGEITVIVKYFFQSCPFSIPSGTLMTQILYLLYSPTDSWGFVHFLVFSVLFRLGCSYSSLILSSVTSILLLGPFTELFVILVIVFSLLKCPFGSSLDLYFSAETLYLLRLFIFSSVSSVFIIAHWNIFIMVAVMVSLVSTWLGQRTKDV